MTVAKCPKCNEPVSVPPKAPADASVQCPWCAAEYSLQSVLERLPPMLIVLGAVDSDSAEQMSDDRLGLDFGSSSPAKLSPLVADDEEYSIAPSSTPVPAFQVERPAASGVRVSSTKGRPRKKSAGPLRTILPVVLGGMVSLPIVQMALYWIPQSWSSANRDPFDLAPTIGKYAAFLLPSHMRPGTTAEQSSSPLVTPRENTAGGSFVANDGAGLSTIPTFEFGKGVADASNGSDGSAPAVASNNTKPKNKKSKADSSGLTNEPAVADASSSLDDIPIPAPTTTAAASTPPTDLSLPDVAPIGPPSIDLDTSLFGDAPKKMATEPPAASSGDAPAATSVAPKVTIGPVRSASVDADELTHRLTSAVSANIAWDTAVDLTNEDRRQLFSTLYFALAELADGVTFSKDPAGGTASEVEKLSQGLTKQADKMQLLGAYSAFWMESEQATSGVVLAGTVVRQQSANGLHELVVRLPSRVPREITVLSAVEIPTFAADAQVLVLGSLLSNPKEQFGGYTGDATRAVAAGAIFPAVN